MPATARSLAPLALLVVCLGACRAAEDLWAPPSMACKSPLPDSLAPPQGATVSAVLNGTVSRTFTCPNMDDYEYSTELRTKDGELVAMSAGTSDDPLRTYSFLPPGGSPEEAVATVATDFEGAVKFPLDDAADWERRPIVNATGAAEGAAYIIRTNTLGTGEVSCDGVADGDTVTEAYSGIYTFYSCLA